jgi:small subunit ribosomal protein S9
MPQQAHLYQSTGRRKEAVARVRVMPGNGQMTVNGKPISEVYRGIILQKKYQRPFELTKTLGTYTATIKVIGGGTFSQLDAIVHGLARALAHASEEHKATLKKNGLLTRDPRVRERRKYGLAHAARAKKQSPKR